MALTIDNPEIERLADTVASMTGESEIDAIRRALEERKERLLKDETPEEKHRRLTHFLETRIWPHIKPEYLGKLISKEEEAEILGYGPGGV